MRKGYRPIIVDGDIGTIILTKGKQAIIDACEVSRVSSWNWRAAYSPHRRCFYAGRRIVNKHGRNSTITLHRFIMGVTDSKIIIDHINHDPLDCRRCNLRICTPTESSCNKRLYRNSPTGFKGVRLDKKRGTYFVCIKVDGVNHTKWGFKTAEAAFAYRQEFFSKLHGEFYYAG